MSSWEQRFEEHALWAKVGALKVKAEEVDKSSDEDIDSREYIIATADMILARQESTPALLVTPQMLQNVTNTIDNLSSTIDTWKNGGYNYQQVDAAVAAVLDQLAAWPPLAPDVATRAFSTNAKRIAKVADDVVDAVETRRTELENNVAELKAESDKIRGEIDEHKAALSSTITAFQEATTATLTTAAEKWEAARDDQEDKAKKRLEKLEELEAEARDLVHAATGSVVATDYGRYARNKSISAWACDIAAAVLGAAGVTALLLHLFREGVTGDGNVGLSLTRLAASIGTLGVAAIVAKRGTEHHREARAAKRTDLALRKVGPFTENLPDDVRERVIVELTERIFIRGELDDGPEAADDEPSLMDRVIQTRKLAKEADGN